MRRGSKDEGSPWQTEENPGGNKREGWMEGRGGREEGSEKEKGEVWGWRERNKERKRESAWENRNAFLPLVCRMWDDEGVS